MGLLNILFGNTRNELLNYIDKGSVILDVRTDAEYRTNHVNKAMHIPLQELEYRFEEIKKLNKSVIVYCASGMRSHNAANFLKSIGIDAINGGGIAKVKAALQ